MSDETQNTDATTGAEGTTPTPTVETPATDASTPAQA